MNERKTLLILGAGGYGCTLAEAVHLKGLYEPIGFLDDLYPERDRAFGLPVFGTTKLLDSYLQNIDAAVVAIGDNHVRQNLFLKLQSVGHQPPPILHPEAKVSPSAVVGSGTTVMAGAVIGTQACLGQGVIINAGCTVDHHAEIYDFAHLGVGSCVAGGSIVDEGAWLRAGCSVGYQAKAQAWEIYPPGTILGE